jgi:hypothetical protein
MELSVPEGTDNDPFRQFGRWYDGIECGLVHRCICPRHGFRDGKPSAECFSEGLRSNGFVSFQNSEAEGRTSGNTNAAICFWWGIPSALCASKVHKVSLEEVTISLQGPGAAGCSRAKEPGYRRQGGPDSSIIKSSSIMRHGPRLITGTATARPSL